MRYRSTVEDRDEQVLEEEVDIRTVGYSELLELAHERRANVLKPSNANLGRDEEVLPLDPTLPNRDPDTRLVSVCLGIVQVSVSVMGPLKPQPDALALTHPALSAVLTASTSGRLTPPSSVSGALNHAVPTP